MTMDADRPTFAEKYGRATQSANLRHVERPCDTDKLTALAWADRRLSSPLYRARVANDAAQVRALHDLWRAECARLALRRRWTIWVPAVTADGKHVTAQIVLPMLLVREVARISLEHYLFDICPTCQGRKYRLLRDVLVDQGAVPEVADIQGRDTLSDDLCPACGGTGKPEIAAPAYLLPLVRAAVESLEGRYRSYGAAAVRRLAPLVRSAP